jgi:hypothetical protein
MVDTHAPEPTRRYEFGGHVYGLTKIDDRDRYTSATLDCRLVGQLELDPEIAAAARHFSELVRDYPGHLVLFDGPRLVISDAPRLDRAAAGGILRLRFRQTSYFVAALCRGVINGELADYLAAAWSCEFPDTGQIRAILKASPCFHPLEHPGAGVGICPVAFDAAGRPWTVLHQRGPSVAVNPGMWSTGVHESFSMTDVVARGGGSAERLVDPWATARRGAREELGVDLLHAELFGFGLDPAEDGAGRPSTGGGFTLVGWGEVGIPARRLTSLRLHGSDSFEAQRSLAVRLSADGVVAALAGIRPEQIFGPSVYALAGTLERLCPGSAEVADQRLARAWGAVRRPPVTPNHAVPED